MAAEFHHFGVPTTEVQPNETLIEGAGVYVTDPGAHPYKIEFLRFTEDTAMPAEVCSTAHAAFIVESLDEALKGQEVIIPPFDATEELRCAFIKDGTAIIELMEKRQ
ncbi:MAG TPA: hypothetical protein PLZ53_01975 [Candidatus Hydrogenedentes bacterium]|jgi:hypothetical protein|nr:MAG: hypothetical protein BWY07_01947 [Candidatus Hydrogenedentes bacterium ADurb.Bin170]HOD96334.1 hypothetical protein [Candidatus Hydrogenedentota bacterium]HOH41853.1 hypothetical protein [Candidatus Hydrogenedentota bacterium]HOM48075.1 hypothetical protein [Candidatus Hydrogenedentota bacterium]HOR50920.1 hypothetical protein [Candidatus Hydrogenedentota bacterium]